MTSITSSRVAIRALILLGVVALVTLPLWAPIAVAYIMVRGTLHALDQAPDLLAADRMESGVASDVHCSALSIGCSSPGVGSPESGVPSP